MKKVTITIQKIEKDSMLFALDKVSVTDFSVKAIGENIEVAFSIDLLKMFELGKLFATKK